MPKRRLLLHLNISWLSRVRNLDRCALGVYMRHPRDVLANLTTPTQEDIQALLPKIPGALFVVYSWILPQPTQADENLVGNYFSDVLKVCLYVSVFISLISLECSLFASSSAPFFRCSHFCSCQANSSPANKR